MRHGSAKQSTQPTLPVVTEDTPTFLPDPIDELPEGGGEVIELARDMSAAAPSGRPTAREVERRCQLLLRTVRGPGLADFAEDAVPAATAPPEKDALYGTVLYTALSPHR